ncbi:ABC transporter substrate-binding protein [Azospirillum halopraeferens]|uniref:ABC transporter substrate-binding protein n=1 Tax=Azospirillum halopraeferens TaxID=34010 RepID=UPI00042600D6|nr:ABC transporter substrate-binding protein [Azospirillum halopraeferens]
MPLDTGIRRLAAAAALLAGAAAAPPAAAQTTVTIACSALGIGHQLCREGAEAWAQETGNAVRFVATPKSATDQLALYQQLLAAGSADIDVFQIDVVWPGILGDHFLDLADHIDPAAAGEHLPVLVETATVDGRLVALPWFIDMGLLYYREDLLRRHGRPVPTTWADLEQTARLIRDAERAAGNDRMWGYVWQGRAYEGLTVNALEWIDSFGGGTIVGDDGAVTVNNPQAVEALATAAGWVGTITPQGVLNYTEEEARGAFQSGNAVFMRNWPYAWPLVNGSDSPVKGMVGVAPLPRGGTDGKHTGALGGQMLAVNRMSAVPDAAADLVRHLTGAQEQKRRAMRGGYNPTRPALYEDADLIAVNPVVADLAGALPGAVARPSRQAGQLYNQLSAELYQAVHRVLSGSAEAADALAGLERSLERLNRRSRR